MGCYINPTRVIDFKSSTKKVDSMLQTKLLYKNDSKNRALYCCVFYKFCCIFYKFIYRVIQRCKSILTSMSGGEVPCCAFDCRISLSLHFVPELGLMPLSLCDYLNFMVSVQAGILLIVDENIMFCITRRCCIFLLGSVHS
jgi:hypothetical protein